MYIHLRTGVFVVRVQKVPPRLESYIAKIKGGVNVRSGLVREIDYFINHYALSDLIEDCVRTQQTSNGEKIEFAKISVELCATPGYVKVYFELYNGAILEFTKQLKVQ